MGRHVESPMLVEFVCWVPTLASFEVRTFILAYFNTAMNCPLDVLKTRRLAASPNIAGGNVKPNVTKVMFGCAHQFGIAPKIVPFRSHIQNIQASEVVVVALETYSPKQPP